MAPNTDTDNGTPFDTRMLVSLCRKHDVFLVHGRPYHPQSQGKVERLNRTLKNMVRKMQEDDALLPRQPWLQHLAHAIFVYNRTPHSKTGVPPFTAFYGRKPTEGLTFTGEWEMCAVERDARDIVYSRKPHQSQDDQPQDDNDILEYAKQLAAPNDDAERGALFTYLTKQQPLLLAQIRALQDHKNLEMVRRSIRGQSELKPVHPGDRVVFSKMSGIALGMAANPFQNLLIGNVIDAHLGGVIQSFTIKEDNQVIHQRVPRQNIGIRIPGYNVTDTMKSCATRNITAQAQAFVVQVAQSLDTEAPASCIDDQPGLRSTTFAQAPSGDPTPAPSIELEAGLERHRLAGEELHLNTAPASSREPGRNHKNCEGTDFSETPQAGVPCISKHEFVGGCSPGCVCNGCTVTLGGRRKYCTTCYKDSGLTFCKRCHNKRQPTK